MNSADWEHTCRLNQQHRLAQGTLCWKCICGYIIGFNDYLIGALKGMTEEEAMTIHDEHLRKLIEREVGNGN